ncbi:hypothetical protein ACFONL_00110 [Camelimonas fluminis]|uniref:Uncharacterized protein n=1 Tax=Camelimonas fluminis TaxID=1576911 RepID=A0ABV7UBT5_9HYPH|nr:hypothetical protein [Camelimonas fluminis]
MTDEGALLARLKWLATDEKTPLDTPQWSETEGRGGRRISIVCPLSIDGSLVSGLRLEIHGPQATLPGRPFYGLAAHLFATERARTWHLGRVEFDPEDNNKTHKNRPNRAGAPASVSGPHIHDFEASFQYGSWAFTPSGNLPIAFPLDIVPANFDGILDIIRSRFNIPGLWMEAPAWSRKLI